MKAILFVIMALFFFTSCQKAGTGGNATLVVFPQHHTKPIINRAAYLDTIYVKFNAKELPGTKASDFDTYFVGEAKEDHVHCKDLKPGDYFLYGAGFDTTISKRVTGGMHIQITHKERKEEIDVNLPVTES